MGFTCSGKTLPHLIYGDRFGVPILFLEIANSINSQSYPITLIAGGYLAEDTRTKLESGNLCTKYSEREGSLYGQSPSSPRSRHQMKVFLLQADTRTRHLIEEWLMAWAPPAG